MMIRKPLDLPPAVARAYDYFSEDNPTERDAIAAHQLSVLGQYQNPREMALRLSDIKAMFRQMREKH